MWVSLDYVCMLPAFVLGVGPWLVMWWLECWEYAYRCSHAPPYEERMGAGPDRMVSPHYGPRGPNWNEQMGKFGCWICWVLYA